MLRAALAACLPRAALAACLPGAQAPGLIASMTQVGFWKADSWQPSWGTALVEHFLACLEDKGAEPCTSSLLDTAGAVPRWRWRTTPPHLIDHQTWRNKTLGTRAR